MIREVSFNEISDGRTYTENDMVKVDTAGCVGCHKCCTGMGSSIVLDPYDVWRLKTGLGKSFQELLNEGELELNMVDGLILPNLKMNEDERCTFLNEEGRCYIHKIRPGICRIFPLGRIYENGDYKYFLQKDQCIKENRAKIKLKKWIDIANISENHRFINAWHSFIKTVGQKNINLRNSGRGESINDIAMFVLNDFFVSDILTEEQAQVIDEGLFYMIVLNKIDKAIKIINDIN